MKFNNEPSPRETLRALGSGVLPKPAAICPLRVPLNAGRVPLQNFGSRAIPVQPFAKSRRSSPEPRNQALESSRLRALGQYAPEPKALGEQSTDSALSYSGMMLGPWAQSLVL
jgi:hypothetical protein